MTHRGHLKLSVDFARTLDAEDSVVVVLDQDGIIRFVNHAWTRSAQRDEAPGCLPEAVLGRRYLDFVLGDLNLIVSAAFERAARQGPGLASIWLNSECNTPETYRQLTTRISLLWTAGEDKGSVGYVVHNEVRAIGPMNERHQLIEASAGSWRGAYGLIRQCSCCRRVLHPETRRWAMCVALLETPELQTSHGLCELCLGTYYG